MAHPIDWQSLARSSPLLSVLPDQLRGAARHVTLPRSAQLFARGDKPAAMWFVLSGEVHLVRSSRSGHAIVLQRGRGGFLAEASLDQASYHCDAVAVTDSELLMLPRREFLAALADEQFRSRWIALLARELRRVRAHAERLGLKTARERIVHYIETEGERGSVTLTQSKKDWATELGLTHEALYRAVARMEREGLIRAEGARLVLEQA